MVIKLEKVVLNIGIGSNEQQLGSAKALLEKLTGHKPIATVAKKRNPNFKITKNQAIGAMVTLRGREASEMLARAFDAKNNSINKKSIVDDSVSFGIKEYIDFSNIKYDPKIGMLGLNVNARFSKNGARVERRKRKRSRISDKYKRVSKKEIEEFIKNNYKVNIIEE